MAYLALSGPTPSALPPSTYAWTAYNSEGPWNSVYCMKVHSPLNRGSNTRTAEKHAIRKALHPQLREAWNEFPFLRRNVNAYATETSYHKFGFHFIPLVNGQQAPHCRLDILFLRRDAPGNLIRSGGDLDNRMKVLFDGLKMPSSADELGSATPWQDENPFFVLTEDDSLITEVKITTDRLLKPQGAANVHDVVLVLYVKTPRSTSTTSKSRGQIEP